MTTDTEATMRCGTGRDGEARKWIRGLEEIGLGDVALVGGKTASLGELHRHLGAAGVFRTGSRSPPTPTATSSRSTASASASPRLRDVDGTDVGVLAAAGAEIRAWLETAPWPDRLGQHVLEAYRCLGQGSLASVAVRSSATAEDLPEASFAGQQEPS